MNLHEYQSKQVFAAYGIPVPTGRVAATPEEAVAAAEALGGGLWVVKAQVHAGGRGKAGGVKLARDKDAVHAAAKAMLGTRLATIQTGPEGVPVDVILQPHEIDPPNHKGAATRHVAVRHLSRPVASHAPLVTQSAIELAKLSRLLPAVVLGPLSRDPNNKRRDWAREQDLIYVDATDILAYEDTASRNLQQVAQAHVPLEGAENARILAWRPSDGGKEHLAIVVGEIDPTEPVLIRLHSECFTGDLLGSG